jgi:Transmembrane domain of unknown function (DUF3566)
VASREERQGRWDPEAPGASGGHLAPDVAATGPLFDPVTGSVEAPSREPGAAPWLDDPAHAPSESLPPRTDVVPANAPVDRPRPSGPARRRFGVRRVKRTIHHVTPFSVLKLSLFFYAAFLILWLIFVAIVYWILSNAGFFEAFERFRRSTVLWEDLDLSLWVFERWALVIGLVMAVVGSLFNTFLAVLYNFGADTVGGVEVTFVERDLSS